MNEKSKYFPTPIFHEDDKYLHPFVTIETIVEHTTENTNEMNCTNCNLTFNNLADYENHKTKVHKKKILTCNICTATFGRQDHLKRHFKSLHLNQNYCNCPVCGKECKRHDILQQHIKEKHSNTAVIFNCRECDFQCNRLKVLEKHESSHFLSERHVCEYCEVTFKRKDHMLRHVKSQHLNLSVSCPVCGQSYKRRDHVARHVREKHKMGLINGKLITSVDLV